MKRGRKERKKSSRKEMKKGNKKECNGKRIGERLKKEGKGKVR